MLAHKIVADPGAGPWVFFLHGFLGSGRNLGSLARGYAAGRPDARVVTVDLPGHGGSGPAPGPGMAGLAGPVLELVDDLAGREAAEVIGHSLGGRTALAMQRDRPGRLARATLLDIAPARVTAHHDIAAIVAVLADAPSRAESRAAMRTVFTDAGISRPLADWLLMNLTRDDAGGYTWRIDRQALLAGHRVWSDEDLWPVVETPGHPVEACVRGGRSGFVDAAAAARLEAAGVRVSTVEGAGHFLHAEKPAAVLEALGAR